MYYYKCKNCEKTWIYPVSECIFCGGEVWPVIVNDVSLKDETKVYVPSPAHKEVPYLTELLENKGHRFFRKAFEEKDRYQGGKGKGRHSKVSVVKTKYDPMVATIGALSLIANDIAEAKTVLIKPNLALAKEGDSGIVTNPRVVAGVLSFLIKERGMLSKNIVVAECSVLGFGTEAAFRKSGLDEVCREFGVKFMNLSDGKYIDKKISYGGKTFKFGVAKRIYEVDLVVNVPVIKTHFQTDWSMALKNMKGVVDFETRKVMHREDLHLQIALLNKVLPKYLTVMDGSVGLEGMGPAMLGKPANLGLVVASADVVAAEKIVSLITGLKWPRHSKMAAKLGLGRSGKARIEVLGEEINSVKKEFLPADQALSPHHDVDLVDGRPCSGCLNNVWLALSKLRTKRGKKVTVAFGKDIELDSLTEYRKLLAVGSCAIQRLTGLACSGNLPGCPPSVEEIMKLVDKALEED